MTAGFEAECPATLTRNGVRLTAEDEGGDAVLWITDPLDTVRPQRMTIMEDQRPMVAAMLREACGLCEDMITWKTYIVERQGNDVSLMQMSLMTGRSATISIDEEDAERLAEWLDPEEAEE